MPTIDRLIVRNAFERHAATLHAAVGSGHHLLMMLIAGTSLDDGHLLDFIHTQFDEFELPYKSICFALAETTAITSLTRALTLIHALKQRGCRFALDDFGSGMSSFTYLKHM